MKTICRSVLSLAAAAFVLAPAAHAQSQSASASVSATVVRTAHISLSSSSITFPTPTAAEFQAGYTQSTSINLNYGSNAGFLLGYQFADTWLNGSGGNRVAVTRVQQSVDGGPESAMQESMASWRTGFTAGDYSDALTYRLQLNWTTAPDVYTGELTYVISAS
jgi:hypothetical protein